MQVSGIDHINIVADDLDEVAAFYERALGLRRTESAGGAMGFKGAWMCDAAGNAIVHLVWKDPASDRYAHRVPGQSTNGVDHVALRCTGFDATRERLDLLGVPYRVNDRQFGNLRQIFLTDPSAVNIELNFSGD